MKRPTVNPKSFKAKFKENNYNNNKEALIDYDAGVSLAIIESCQESPYSLTPEQLSKCKATTGNHNEILLEKFEEWTEDLRNDKQASLYCNRSQMMSWHVKNKKVCTRRSRVP